MFTLKPLWGKNAISYFLCLISLQISSTRFLLRVKVSSDVWNSLAIAIAERFLSDQLTFDAADHAINVLWSLMVQDVGESEGARSLPEPADSIYLAFDAGEFDHSDGADPVEKFTKPELQKIIDAEQRT